MKPALIVMIIVVAVSFGIDIAGNILRKKYYAEMVELVNQKKYDEFEQLANKKLVKVAVSRFDVEYLRLNAVLENGSRRQIDEQFKRIIDCSMNNYQKVDSLMLAFDYYLSAEDAGKAKEYGRMITELNSPELSSYVKRMYDIRINRSARFLNEMLEELKDGNVSNRWQKEYMVSLMYEINGDTQHQKEYEQLSKQHLAEMGEAMKGRK